MNAHELLGGGRFFPTGGRAIAQAAPDPAAPTDIPAVSAETKLAVEVRRETARRHLEKARELKDKLRYGLAEKELQEALRLDPTLSAAQVELDEVQFLLGRLVGERRETIRKIEDDQVLLVEQAQAQLKRLFADGEALMAQNKYEQALEKFSRVVEIDSHYPWSLNMPDLVKAARAHMDTCARKGADQKAEEQRRLEADLRDRVKGDRVRELVYIENRIKLYKTQAEEALQENRFDKAEQQALLVLEIDPRDAEAQAIRARARYLRHLFTMDKIERETRRNWDLVLRGIMETTVSYHHIFQFPPRRVWEKLGEERISLEEQVAAEEPVANREVRRSLETTRIPRISFEDRPLQEVLDYLGQLAGPGVGAGISFVPNKAAREAMESEDLKVNLPEVQGLMLKNVLDIVLESVGEGYGYQIQNGAVVIGPRSSLTEKMHLAFYSVEDIANQHPDYPAPDLSVSLAGGKEQGGAVTLDVEQTETARTGLPGEQLVELIRKRILGGDDKNGTAELQTGKLVVRTSLENHRKISDLLASLRKLSGVLVASEARFIDIQDNLLEEIGVNIGGTVESTPEYPIPDVNGLGTSLASGYVFLDRRERYGMIGANISDYSGVMGTEITPFNITAQGGMALQFNKLEDYQLEGILSMVQKKQKMLSLGAPRVLAFDSQTAHTMVIDQIAYIKDVDVNQTGVSPVINPLIGSFRVGALLEIRPTVTHDRKFVILEVNPTTAKHIDSKYADLSLAQGFTMVQVELPVILLSRIQTTITIPDGGSVLVGGLKKVIEQDKSIGIPLLQRIPLLNILFGRQGQSRLRSSLYVLIKSDIVIVKEEEKLTFP